jgi:FolB domain-containing protein
MDADNIALDDLHLDVVVGVNPGERIKKQPVVFSLKLHCDLRQAGDSDDVAHTVNYASVAKLIQRFCDRCHAFTLEALASGCVSVGAPQCKILEATIRETRYL